jgi:hypothetical protein
MSALELTKITKGDHGFCVNRCEGIHGIRPGSHRVFICGYPVGVLCAGCSKDWQAMWTDAQVTLRIKTDPWPRAYIMTNPVVTESAMFGPLLSGRFHVEGEEVWEDEGSVRLDRLTLIEPVEAEHDQLPLPAKAAA